MKSIFKFFVGLLVTILGLAVLYAVAAFILSVIPVNSNQPAVNEGIEVYISTNGVHADFIVPVKNQEMNWNTFLNLNDYPRANANFEYVAFGWGDKGFYLNTPQWRDLSISTAVNAILFPSATAMHVTYHRRAPKIGDHTRKILLTKEQYKRLTSYILTSFEQNTVGTPVLIPNGSYSPYDNFYEAEGSYSLFFTCNNWANKGLQEIGVKTSVWSPFDKGILYHLDGK